MGFLRIGGRQKVNECVSDLRLSTCLLKRSFNMQGLPNKLGAQGRTMTAQIHERLIVDGEETSMAFCPPLPAGHPRIFELGPDVVVWDPSDSILGSTACWAATWARGKSGMADSTWSPSVVDSSFEKVNQFRRTGSRESSAFLKARCFSTSTWALARFTSRKCTSRSRMASSSRLVSSTTAGRSMMSGRSAGRICPVVRTDSRRTMSFERRRRAVLPKSSKGGQC